MKEYDVFIAGGAIAGPVAAKFCAKQGLKTLLVEKDRVPREKPCSGIQFPYFEKIIGDPIPRARLCNNVLSKTEMHLPNGRVISADFPMLNFMRDVFDEWLCLLAQDYGAEFRDGCRFIDLVEVDDGIEVHLKTDSGEETIRARYVIDATGMRPVIRRQLRKYEDFERGSTGAALNYHFTADGNLEADKLYQFWNIEFNKMMFAWVYNKTPKAIGIAERTGKPVIDAYAKEMKHLVKQTRKNQEAGVLSFETNEALQAYLNGGLLKMGLNLILQRFLNRLRSPERQVMLP